MLSTTGGKLGEVPKENIRKIHKIKQINLKMLLALYIEKTIQSLKKAVVWWLVVQFVRNL